MWRSFFYLNTLLIYNCLLFHNAVVNGQFCMENKLSQNYSVTLHGERQTVQCCPYDLKPAFCFTDNKQMRNVHFIKHCQCMILQSSSISSRRPKVNYCKWKQRAPLVISPAVPFAGGRGRDIAYLVNAPTYYHYTCEVATDKRCPDEFEEEEEEKDMDCIPDKYGFPASAVNTKNLYLCDSEEEFDYLTVPTCTRQLCDERYRYNRQDKTCQPPRRMLPEYLGYLNKSSPLLRHCTYEVTNSRNNGTRCIPLPFCRTDSTESHPKLEKYYLPPPLPYMVKKMLTTVGMDYHPYCHTVCPKHLNIPNPDCQIMPTCDDDGRMISDPAFVRRCLPECTAEQKTNCNRRPWCLYVNGTWVMPSEKHDIFSIGKCEIRTCKRYETEFKDNCVRKAQTSKRRNTIITATLVKVGTGLFIGAMFLVYFGIMFYPVPADVPVLPVASSVDSPTAVQPLSVEDVPRHQRSSSGSVIAPITHYARIIKSLGSQTLTTEGSGMVSDQPSPFADARKSE